MCRRSIGDIMWSIEKLCPAAGEKGRAMKRLLYLLLAVVLIGVLLLSCSKLRQKTEPAASGDDPVSEVQQIEQETPAQTPDEQAAEIEALADRCRAACNAVDVEGILDCPHVWTDDEDALMRFATVGDNLGYSLGENPCFVNPTRGDYRVVDGSGFPDAHFELMGRY